MELGAIASSGGATVRNRNSSVSLIDSLLLNRPRSIEWPAFWGVRSRLACAVGLDEHPAGDEVQA